MSCIGLGWDWLRGKDTSTIKNGTLVVPTYILSRFPLHKCILQIVHSLKLETLMIAKDPSCVGPLLYQTNYFINTAVETTSRSHFIALVCSCISKNNLFTYTTSS